MALEQVGAFFEAAAAFYRQAPWRTTPPDRAIKVECGQFDSGPWHALVLGQSGVELGLALYEDLDVVKAIVTRKLQGGEAARRNSGLAVMFDEALAIHVRDLDAAERHGWPVAGPEAHPLVMRALPGGGMRPPLAWELQLLEAALRAVPDFLRRNAQEASMTVCTGSGELELTLSWMDVE